RGRFGEMRQQPGVPHAINARLWHKDGSWRPVESRATMVFDPPSVEAVVWNIHNVSGEKPFGDERRERPEDVADFIENAPIALHWVGPNGTILGANQAELDLLGYRREEFVGRDIKDFHADPSAIADLLQRATQNEAIASREGRIRCRDGS